MTTVSETTAVPPRIIVVLNEARRSMTRVFPRSAKAFTLIELLVVIIVLAGVLASLLPAMTKTNTAISTFQCLNNNRQLCIAWRMYGEDNRGRLVYSSDDGTSNPLNQYAWTLTHLDYSPALPGNWDTNADIVVRPLFPYTGRNPSIYKCPSDRSFVVISGVPRPRIRTMVMNFYLGGFAGTDGGWSFATPYMLYTNLSTIQSGGPSSPGAAKLWLFMDMREDLINWGNFMVNMTGYSPSNPTQYQFTSDLPGFYHNRSATFSFADGHGELHKWLDSRTTPALAAFGSSVPASIASPRNPDIAWLQDHSSRPK